MTTLAAIQQPPALAKIAYEALRDSILAGRLRSSEVYSEKVLADELGISKTPVREALLELSAQGLVQFLPRRGVRVTHFSKKDAQEVFVCAKCAGRIMARGCRLPGKASVVWDNDGNRVDSCACCGKIGVIELTSVRSAVSTKVKGVVAGITHEDKLLIFKREGVTGRTAMRTALACRALIHRLEPYD